MPYQAAATLELEIIWGKEVATLTVQPWLGYTCSIGARIQLRKLGAASGQCATVQRVLQDDRVVARVDSYSKEDGVKGEVIMDIQPANVIPTTFPHYARDTKLLLLHDKKLVDASVLHWVGGTQFEEGSRHMISVKPPDAKSGQQVWHDLNQFNHVAVPADGSCTAASFEVERVKYCAWVCAHEDKVEDAITGNLLLIKDQLIFLELAQIPNGLAPPQYAPSQMKDVPGLVKEQMEASPKRSEGTHTAQPVLVRAGPGTGKTWMIKQALFLLAETLGNDETAGEGVRLVPVIVFVQRIVRLLREFGEDPQELLENPNGLLRWYISSEFVEMHEERKMLLTAHEMRACVVLVDGVDEAAGMRDIVEAFVHYELVPSGNRLMVTSRPEGVDIEDYKMRFVVVNLKELSQEQQRTVIQMQLKGNRFFEHLVNIAECRKTLDKAYKESFRTESMRIDMEDLHFGLAELHKVDERVAEEAQAAQDANAAREAERDGEEVQKGRLSEQEQAEETAFQMRMRWAKLNSQAVEDRKGFSRQPRKLMLDSQPELQTYLEQAEAECSKELRHAYVQGLNKRMMSPSRIKLPGADGVVRPVRVFELLEQEFHTATSVPSPCTRAHVEPLIHNCSSAMTAGIVDADWQEALRLIALQRKLPVSGGKRGARAVPILSSGLWHTAVAHTEETYLAFDAFMPELMQLMKQVIETSSVPIKVSASDVKYRNPVDLWIESTFLGGKEAEAEVLPIYCASIVLRLDDGQHCVSILSQLMSTVKGELKGKLCSMSVIGAQNRFNAKEAHPSHLRSCSLQLLLTSEGRGSTPVRIVIEHKALNATYHSQEEFKQAYDFFWDRSMHLSLADFDIKLEVLLTFLVEAIGVPVLLSLLLLTYSATKGAKEGNDYIFDLDELPDTRLQLYKLGISAGIFNRMAWESNKSQEKNQKQEKEAEKQAAQEAAADGGGRARVKRKTSLEEGMGSAYGSSGGGGGGKEEAGGDKAAKRAEKNQSDGPVMDLNSILRGKKVRVVTGEEEVADCYALCVRVLMKAKTPGFDMRTGIVAVVPKSHPMHMIVTALVEYVLIPPPQTEAQLNDCAKKMLRHVAVDNQENGRREFTSKDVACVAGAHPDELGLWSRLALDDEHGIALVATLAGQTDKAPAQYQFKHLSFQEGLYAEYLLLTVTSLAPPAGPGWPGWVNDKAAAGEEQSTAPAELSHLEYLTQSPFHRLTPFLTPSLPRSIPQQPLHEQHLPHRLWLPRRPSRPAAQVMGLP